MLPVQIRRWIGLPLIFGCYLLISSTASAQEFAVTDVITKQFLDKYKTHEPDLYKKFATNRRCRCAFRTYLKLAGNQMAPQDVPDTGELEVISDGSQFRLMSVGNPAATWANTRYYWSPTLSYYLIMDKDGKRLVNMQGIAAVGPSGHERIAEQGYHLLPLRLGGGEFRTSFALTPRPNPKGVDFPPYSGKSLRETTWQGKKAVELVLELTPAAQPGTKPMPEERKYYFDPDNSYAALGMETSLRPGTFYKVPHREINVIEYHVTTEKYPLPKSFRQSYILADGTRKRVMEVDFLSNERYTPKPEEFRLEEEFGLTTPDVSNVGNPRRAWPYWLLGFGLLLGAAVVVWLVFRRRKQAQ